MNPEYLDLVGLNSTILTEFDWLPSIKKPNTAGAVSDDVADVSFATAAC